MTHLSLDELIDQIEAAAPDAPALRRLSLAVLGAEELGRTADDLLGHYVALARAEGVPWAEVGAAMGVTKQAAQQRHTAQSQRAERSHDVDEVAGLDDGARAALDRARDEARILWHHYVGTEHVLVGVLRTHEALAEALGCSADDAVATAVAIVDRGTSEVHRPPLLTARARKTVDLAALVATERGHDLVTPADLVLGILREGRGVGAQILDQRSGGIEAARAAVLALDRG